jgi:glycosyltransferase involved in cell wall biosynthesis
MRILMLHSLDLKKQAGGDKTHLVEELRNLKKLGNDVLLVVPGYKPISKEKFPFDVYYIPVGKKGYSSFIAYHLKLLWEIKKILEEFRPDVVYSRAIMNSFLIYKILKKRNVPLVIKHSENFYEEYIQMGFPYLLACLYGFLDRINSRNCDGIICITKGIKEKMIERYKLCEEKLTVIENGANPSLFRPLDKQELRTRFGFSQDDFIVGFPGQFAPEQSLDVLVYAANVVKQKGYNFKYLLIGKGAEKPKIVELIKKYSLLNEFRIIDEVKYEEVPIYMNIFDVGITIPTRAVEPCPVKFFEYIFCGVPVVYTSNVHPGKIFPTKVGFIVKNLNPFDLAEALIEAFKEAKDVRAKLIEHREEFVEKYSWLSTARKTEKYLEEIVKRKAGFKE